MASNKERARAQQAPRAARAPRKARPVGNGEEGVHTAFRTVSKRGYMARR